MKKDAKGDFLVFILSFVLALLESVSDKILFKLRLRFFRAIYGFVL